MTMLSIEQLKEHEGYRSTPYTCTAGKLTIGYGLNLEAGITEDEAEIILAHRVEGLITRLTQSFPFFMKLNEPRKAVLINMAYQLGFKGLLNFSKTLAHIKACEYESAACEMLNSRWAKQTPNRAEQLAQQMLAGEWQ
ncbi:glycoside hydrolase [Pseudoalteromonas sp. S16_S37]|nr:glycoside hydrolase [Pseudoalteromonas sp. S16_S37]